MSQVIYIILYYIIIYNFYDTETRYIYTFIFMYNVNRKYCFAKGSGSHLERYLHHLKENGSQNMSKYMCIYVIYYSLERKLKYTSIQIHS